MIGPVCWLYDKIKYAALLEKVYNRLTILHNEEEKEFFASYRRLRSDTESVLSKISYKLVYTETIPSELVESLGRLRQEKGRVYGLAMNLDSRFRRNDVRFYSVLMKDIDRSIRGLNSTLVVLTALHRINDTTEGMENGN